MKLNMFLKPFLLILTLIFSFSVSAEISRQSDINLERKNFSAAQISLANDIKSDRYDAKTWYFYSRTLYQLNETSAAKQALNNAMNIDKTGSFAKGGMNSIRDFAQSIMKKNENTYDPKNIIVEQLKSAEYHAYLDQLLGPNKYGNENPPPASVIANAKRSKNNIITTTTQKETVNNTVKNDFTPPKSAPITNQNKATPTETEATDGNFKHGAIILLMFLLALIAIFFVIKSYIKARNKSIEQIANKNKATDFFNKFKELNDKIEDRLKDLKSIALNSALYTAISELYDLSLSTLSSLNTDNVKNSDEIIFKNIQQKFSLLNEYYSKNDFDLSLFREDQRRIAKEREEKEKRERELKKQREAEEAVRREKRRVQEAKERAERDARRKEQQHSRSSAHSGSSSGSSSDGLLTGVIIGSILSNNNNNSSSSHSRSSDDDNDSLFGNRSNSFGRSSDSDNSSLWGSSSSSRSGSDSNDSLWSGSGSSSSGSSDDSSSW